MSNVIKSNNDFLKENTSIISSTLSLIDSSVFSCKESYSSTTNCPPKEPPIVDTFLASCNELFEKIKNEVNLINEIGDGIAELDNVMEGKATELDISLSSNMAKEVELREFDNIDMPNYSDIDNQIEAIADSEGIDLTELETPHDAYNYGKINPDNGNNYFSVTPDDSIKNNFGLYGNNNNDKPNIEDNYDNDEEYNYNPYDYGEFDYEKPDEFGEPRLTDGLYRTFTPNIDKSDSNNTIDNENNNAISDNISPFDILVNPKSLSNKIIADNDKDLLSNTIKKAEPIKKIEIPNDNEIVENSSIKKSSTGMIAAAAGLGLASAGAYGVNKYNNNNKQNEVREYTVESYEKEVKDNGYNI